MIDNNLINRMFIGIVEDNNDPEKKQRVRIRIPFLHGKVSEIPTDSLPWSQPEKDLNGTSFKVPQVNKIVSVKFPDGSPYMSVYTQSLHLDVNLQNKIETYDSSKLFEFTALCYDYNTQIYKDDEELYMGFMNNGVRITESKLILELMNKNRNLCFGNEDASEAFIYGNKFFDWFDSFIDTLPNGFLCNGIPVITSPLMIQKIGEYKVKRNSMLSDYIFATDNISNFNNKVKTITNIGDTYELTEKESNVNVEKIKEITNELQTESLILSDEEIDAFNGDSLPEKTILNELIYDENGELVNYDDFEISDEEIMKKINECKDDTTVVDKSAEFFIKTTNSPTEETQEGWYDINILNKNK